MQCLKGIEINVSGTQEVMYLKEKILGGKEVNGKKE